MTRDSERIRTNLYMEVGTNVFISSISLNLETYLSSLASGRGHLYVRAGFGGAGIYEYAYGLGGIIGVTMLAGKHTHYVDTSVGAFLGRDDTSNFFPLPLLDLGYRFQKPGKSFIFRAKAGTLGVGLGLGYAF